jgi:hypothetical protein
MNEEPARTRRYTGKNLELSEWYFVNFGWDLPVGAMSRRQDVERVDQSTTTKVRIDVDYGDLVRELLDGGCGTTNNPAVQLGDEDRRAKYI